MNLSFLSEYVQSSKTPTFNIFLNENIDNIVAASLRWDGCSADELFSHWKQLFVLELRNQNKTKAIEKKLIYREDKWSELRKVINAMGKAKLQFQTEGLIMLGDTASSSRNLLTLVNSNVATASTSSGTTTASPATATTTLPAKSTATTLPATAATSTLSATVTTAKSTLSATTTLPATATTTASPAIFTTTASPATIITDKSTLSATATLPATATTAKSTATATLSATATTTLPLTAATAALPATATAKSTLPATTTAKSTLPATTTTAQSTTTTAQSTTTTAQSTTTTAQSTTTTAQSTATTAQSTATTAQSTATTATLSATATTAKSTATTATLSATATTTLPFTAPATASSAPATASSAPATASPATVTTEFDADGIPDSIFFGPSDRCESELQRLLYKKIANTPFKEKEVVFLEGLQHNSSIKELLQQIAAKKLLSLNWSAIEEEATKQYVSGIVNLIHPYTSEEIMSLVPDTLRCKLDFRPTITKVDAATSSYLDDIMACKSNMDRILEYILLSKAALVKERRRNSQEYANLSIIEQFVNNVNLWSEKEDESEQIFYRRFASILDILLVGTGIVLVDGETTLKSTKSNIGMNKALFQTGDSSSNYARKIDLVLKCSNENEVDLSSNEWKKAKVTKKIKDHQQSKNLRLNSSNLYNLWNQYGVNMTIVMDFVGNNGYIYILRVLDDECVTIAHKIADVIIPTNIDSLVILDETLSSLLTLKSYLLSIVNKVNSELVKIKHRNVFKDVCSTSTSNFNSKPPFICFSPKLNQATKKRKAKDLDSDNDVDNDNDNDNNSNNYDK